MLRHTLLTVSTANSSRQRVVDEKSVPARLPCAKHELGPACLPWIGRPHFQPNKEYEFPPTDEYRRRWKWVDRLEPQSGTQSVPDLEDMVVKKMHLQV